MDKKISCPSFVFPLLAMNILCVLPAAASERLAAPGLAQRVAWERLTSAPFDPGESALQIWEDEAGLMNISTISVGESRRGNANEPEGTLEILDRFSFDTMTRHDASLLHRTSTIGLELVAGTLRPVFGGEVHIVGFITRLLTEDLESGDAAGATLLLPLQIEESAEAAMSITAEIAATGAQRMETAGQTLAPFAPSDGSNRNACATSAVECRRHCAATRNETNSQCLIDLGLDLTSPAGMAIVCAIACPTSGPLAALCIVGCGLLVGTDIWDAWAEYSECRDANHSAYEGCMTLCDVGAF